jgi:hypothetical protein
MKFFLKGNGQLILFFFMVFTNNGYLQKEPAFFLGRKWLAAFGLEVFCCKEAGNSN